MIVGLRRFYCGVVMIVQVSFLNEILCLLGQYVVAYLFGIEVVTPLYDMFCRVVEADATLQFAFAAYGRRGVGAPIQANMDVRHTMYFDQLVKLNATYRIPEFSCQKLSFEQQTIAISNIDSFRDKATQLNSAENKGGAVPLPY
ncbi:hypothetical protein Tco_0863072 [Tanacetum coccineum]